jgi:hypothetical protein
MADPMSGPITRCPWCSAELPAPDVEHCPSCGAALSSATGTEPQLPGVTTLDAEAILRARSEVARPRSRILSFITGEVLPETGDPTSSDSLAPPSDDVRREMLRLQFEAERADLEAETVALKADVLAQQGIHIADLAGDALEAAAAPGESAAPVAGQPAEAAPGEPTEPAEPSGSPVAPAAGLPLPTSPPSPGETGAEDVPPA